MTYLLNGSNDSTLCPLPSALYSRPRHNALSGVACSGKRLLNPVEVPFPGRTAIQVRRVGTSQGRLDHLARNLQEQRIDLLGGLHGRGRRALRRDHLEQGLKRGVEQVSVICAAAEVPCRPALHQAKPLTVPERNVGQRTGYRPAVRQTHGQHGRVQTANELAQALCLRSIALSESGRYRHPKT